MNLSKLQKLLQKYPDIQFSYNKGSEKLFLTGHVLTPVEKQELMYQLHGLPFITTIEDTVVIDEYVWENLNALLITNPAWQGISLTSPSPGKFVVRGIFADARTRTSPFRLPEHELPLS